MNHLPQVRRQPAVRREIDEEAGMSPPSSLRRLMAGIFSPDDPPAAAPPSIPAQAAPSLPKRTRLWALKDKYHCPVVGTCLSMDELVKFGRRFSFAGDLRDEHALHVEAVGRAGTRNAVSEALQKHLDRKYRIQLARFDRAKSDAEVLTLWKEHYARGEVAGAMWATLTHRAASQETMQSVHADVHMLSHQVGAGQAADARRLTHLERANAEARAVLERERKERTRAEACLQTRIAVLEAQREGLQAAGTEARALRERLAAFESGAALIDMGRRLASLAAANEQLRVAAERCWTLEESLELAHAASTALARERDELVAERNALERLLLTEDSSEDACDGRCEGCANPAAGRCVLCVGGRTALVAQYRALAGRLGIRLIHHDGGLEEALSRLPDMINGADAVMCPTDCVSHSAYYQLKRHCKRTGKPCLLFKGAGVSSFAAALARLSSGQVSVAANHLMRETSHGRNDYPGLE